MELHGLPGTGGLPPTLGGTPAAPGAFPAQASAKELFDPLQNEAFDLLGDEHVSESLQRMGLAPEPGRLLAARAQIAETGQLDAKQLEAIEKALSQLKEAGAQEARAAAYLVARRLPATPAAIQTVLGRHDAPTTSAQRLSQILTATGLLSQAIPEPLKRLAKLAVPEGQAQEIAQALKQLVEALLPPEKDLARALAAAPDQREALLDQARSRLAGGLEEHARTQNDPRLAEARDEVRFGQLSSFRSEPEQPPVLSLPLWWNEGRGELRVQSKPDAQAPDGVGASRITLQLDTPHLSRIRVDLLLAQRQVNCQVAVQDPLVADFLSPRLGELKAAIEHLGIRLNALGVKTAHVEASDAPVKGVDLYR